MEIDKIKERLSKKLKPSRYKHVLRVVEMAEILGKDYKNIEDIKLSALLHDCAKGNEEYYREKYYKEFRNLVKVNDDEDLQNPKLVHGALGMIVAKEEYGVSNKDVLNGIRYHSTGREDMSDLEKIVFLSDKIELGREYPGLDEIRDKSYCNLDDGMLISINNSILYLINNNEPISLNTIVVRNDIINKRR